MANVSRRVNAAWLDPISTEPSLLVNRDEEIDRLIGYLDELRETGLHEGHVVLSGARGVGKSIFTRAALARFQRARDDHAVCISVDCRGLKYRPLLSNLARALIDAVRPRAEATGRKDLAAWLDQLNLFATYAEVTRAQVETIGRKYGGDATVRADLVNEIQGRFPWEEQRSLGTTTQSRITVTDELLQDAIGKTLARLATESAPWFVVIFFDNMDQAVLIDSAKDVETLFRRILALRPCVSIVHFRTEALVENVRREASEVIDLPPLSADTLFEIVRRRLDASVELVKAQFPPDSDWTAIRALASVTGNALVFLRWVYGLLRTQSWPPPPSWTDTASLEQIVRTAEPLAGADGELIHRLVRIVDQCDGGRPDVAVQREHLLHGGLASQQIGPDRLTDQEMDLLATLGILLPKHRYEPSLGFRIAPVLDILRPSVRDRLVAFLSPGVGSIPSAALARLSVHGFKSIRELDDLRLDRMNVLIGANGAGKSNFIALFRLLEALASSGGTFPTHVARAGGASALLHDGAATTPEIRVELTFETESGAIDYALRLVHGAPDALIFAEEKYRAARDAEAPWVSLGAGHRETNLHGAGDPRARLILGTIRRAVAYQFHNTSETARIRQRWSVSDGRALKADAANLAPFLLRLRESHLDAYTRIVETIRQIAPFFADFSLEPTQGSVMLEWRERNTDVLFQPHQSSDGTLRMMALVALLLQPYEDLPPLLIVDEPELGLHPYAINILAGLFRSASVHAQIILATQSTAFLDLFSPDEVVVVDRPDRASHFRRLDPEALTEWLTEYSLGELWEKNVLGGRPSR
jgi:predicted ATPase